MAETLGSLVDKLSIKNLRLWHLEETKELEGYVEKKNLVLLQRDRLSKEIDEFVRDALNGNAFLREEKVKLYNKPEDKGCFQHVVLTGDAIDQLTVQNIRLWHLEDEVRMEDCPDNQVVSLKREIDKTNQKRNDLIDKIDELLEKQVKNREEQS